AFIKNRTGINNDQELKAHILTVPELRHFKIRNIHMNWNDYICTLHSGSSSQPTPAYKTVLKIGKERPNTISLNLGCC
ncbi:hypothetical protein BU17DRAFT_23180, partial [Hysterangium stoloniferum]